ncbi:MAG: DNA polymerase III subunit delta' [Deltaproteobacteria bacterium]|nr:DNA polymerase III subunit delta' [Deltaproteobacteria bacterium]
MRLTEIIGHDGPRAMLLQAAARDAVHHAYLFEGPDGVGKRQIAFAFAALMNCTERRPDDDACGACRHCRRILAMAADANAPAHPDILAVAPDGKQIKVAQVREVLKVVPFPPIESAYRVVLVEPADLIGEEAANALLKTLEEPPSRTRFLLVTSRPPALLTTIRSRCQRVRFGRLRDDELARVLTERQGWDAEKAARVVGMADGSVGAALALEGDPVMSRREELVGLFLGVRPGDTAGAFALADALVELGPAQKTALSLLDRVVRDALLVSVGAGRRLFVESLREPLTAWARHLGTEALLARLDLLAETRLAMDTFHTNARLALDRLAVALTAPPGREGVRPVLSHDEIL